MAGVGDYVKAGVEDLKKNPAGMIVGLIVMGVVGGIPLVNFAAGMFTVGYMTMLYKTKKGEPAGLGDMFTRMDMDALMIGVPAAVLGLLTNLDAYVLGTGIIALLCGLLNLALSLALLWAPTIQAVKKGPWMDSFKGSLSFWGANIVPGILAIVVAIALAIVGVILCGIGILVTMPIAQTVFLATYLDKTGQLPAAPPAGAAPAKA